MKAKRMSSRWVATPLSVDMGMNNAICLPPEVLNLTLEDAQQFATAINVFFEEVSIVVEEPNHWEMILNAEWVVQMPSLKQLLSLPLTECLPQGKDATKMNAFMTELQMFLRALSFNEARQKAGQLRVDTLHLRPLKKPFWRFF